MGIAAIAGIVSAGAGVYGAISANKARKDAKKQAEMQNKLQAEQLLAAQEALQGLYGEQQDPAEVFAKILTSMPGLLDKVLPDLRRQSKDTAEDLTRSNLSTFRAALGDRAGEFDRFQDERVRILDEMNPANLGKEEILAQSRIIAPLVPTGTFDPSTGAVAGGTTNAVSLYRNLINGMYQDRRAQYGNAVQTFLTDTENSAIRQQERASSFLGGFLNLASNAAGALTQQTLNQEAQEIQNQAGFLKTLLDMPSASFDSAPYDAAMASGVQNAIAGLASAYTGFTTPRTSTSAGTNQAVYSLSPNNRTVGSRPSYLQNYKLNLR